MSYCATIASFGDCLSPVVLPLLSMLCTSLIGQLPVWDTFLLSTSSHSPGCSRRSHTPSYDRRSHYSFIASSLETACKPRPCSPDCQSSEAANFVVHARRIADASFETGTLKQPGTMSLTVSSTARASEPRVLHNTVWGVRDPVLTRPRPHRAAGRSRDTCRPGTGRRCLGSTLARHGTSVFLQMKDPDATHPRLFSEDSTTSTEEKVKIIMKTRDVLLATRKGANCQRQDADASAARHLETTTPGSRTRNPPDTTHTEPLVDSGHQDTSASADQETPLDVPAQTVLPTPAPTTTQQQPSSTSPGTIAGKLYYMAGALVGALGIFSSLLI